MQLNLQQRPERPDLSRMIEEQKRQGGPLPQKEEDKDASEEIVKKKGAD